MPYVTCPTCGERGKIPSSLIGVRIKCRKCGLSFLVSSPAEKAEVGAIAGAGAAELTTSHATLGPSAAVEAHGIEVEGLDVSAWALPTETAQAIAAGPVAVAVHPAADDTAHEAIPAAGAGAAREYKLLTSRDRCFDGKFELAKLEDALNQLARQGWAARAMLTPHLKGYSGALEEVVVVLLEREHATH